MNSENRRIEGLTLICSLFCGTDFSLWFAGGLHFDERVSHRLKSVPPDLLFLTVRAPHPSQ